MSNADISVPELLNAAMVAHEANRAWCAANGDDSQLSWEDCPDWQCDSAYNGVIFHCDNPDADDAASHNNWMAHKKADGWVYGEPKTQTRKRTRAWCRSRICRRNSRLKTLCSGRSCTRFCRSSEFGGAASF